MVDRLFFEEEVVHAKLSRHFDCPCGETYVWRTDAREVGNNWRVRCRCGLVHFKPLSKGFQMTARFA